MNKFLLLFCLSIPGLSLIAQNNFTEVKYAFNFKDSGVAFTMDYQLLHDSNLNISTYRFIAPLNSTDSIRTTKNTEFGETHINIVKFENSNKQKPEIQKLFLKDSLHAYQNVYGEKDYLIVSEKLPKFDWKITTETKEILKQKVQKANMNFRGRDYEAWFAVDIAIANGPWKFSGLPGLILEISSIDGKYKYTAYSLKSTHENLEIEPLFDKYKKTKRISIYEMLKIIDENKQKQIKYLMSKDPTVTNVKINNVGIETNYSDLDE